MAKIALPLTSALTRKRVEGHAGRPVARVVAAGHGWGVSDVLCTLGPQDQLFDEQHSTYAVALVLCGTFQYRGECGDVLMTPGSFMLGNSGQAYQCRHDHAEGDRCLSFWYTPEYFERLAADAGHRRGAVGFATPRIPPLRELSALAAAATAGVLAPERPAWDELAIRVAAQILSVSQGVRNSTRTLPNAESRVTGVVRRIAERPEREFTLAQMANDAGLSPYHFLRTFEHVTGVAPHQYLRRARLRAAATRLSIGDEKVVDIAFDSGFGDVSNFNRAFRAEFGCSPRRLRASKELRTKN